MANKPVERGPSRRALALRRQTPVRIAASGPFRPPLAPHQSAHARHARRIQIRRRRARPQLAALATRAQQAATEARAPSVSQASIKSPLATLRAVTAQRGPTRRALALRHRTRVRIAASGPSRPPLAPHQSARAPSARQARTRLRNHRLVLTAVLTVASTALLDRIRQLG